MRRLGRRVAMEDPEALAEFDRILSAQKTAEIPLVHDMREAMDNKLNPILTFIEAAKHGDYQGYLQ